jgi:multidrug efflux pump subunit AcrA (membrane-fusion protein)
MVSGPIDELLVKDQQYVERETPLAVINSSASYKDVFLLKNTLGSLDESLLWVVEKNILPSQLRLGSLQAAYAVIEQKQKEHALHLKLNPSVAQQKLVEKQLEEYQRLLVQKEHQLQITDKKLALAEKDFARYRQLYLSAAISDQALEEKEQNLLDIQADREALATEMQQIRVEVAQVEKERQLLQIQYSEQSLQSAQALHAALMNFQTQLSVWEQVHLLKATIAGQVSLYDFWSPSQHVEKGQVVMSINPDTTQQVIGKMKAPIQNSGKVAKGQEVRIYLENYPYQEFGTLQGSVSSISSLPKQGYYFVTIDFPKGLLSGNSRKLPFQQNMQGRAEIITKHRRLVERFIDQVKAIQS